MIDNINNMNRDELVSELISQIHEFTNFSGFLHHRLNEAELAYIDNIKTIVYHIEGNHHLLQPAVSVNDAKHKRLSWESYAMDIARVASKRSEDPYLAVGACALRHDYSIAGTGYNGAPSGIEIDWEDREARRPYVIHAEVNALRYVKPGEVKFMAVTTKPCPACLAVIASYGIKTVYYSKDYQTDPSGSLIAPTLDINLIKI